MKEQNHSNACTSKHPHDDHACTDSCCGKKHSHSHDHEDHHEEHAHGEACHCGHEHESEPEDGHGCSCAACGDGEKETGPRDLLFLGISVLLLIASFLVPDGIFRVLLQGTATLLVGYKMILNGLKGLIRFSLDEMTLMTIAVVAAFAIGEGFEGTLVTLLFHIGEFFENRAVMNSRKRIDALVRFVPENANLMNGDGTVTEVSASGVSVGDLILVKAGERVPLDCEVLEGSSEIDTAAITGESVPVQALAGTKLLSGMINLSGALKCRTLKSSEDSAANKIAELVKDATREKGRTERFITRFSKVYTPIVVVLAILLAVLPPLFGAGTFSLWLGRALIFLVASCPCALVISVPLTFYSVIGAVSKKGALIKGSKHVEVLSKLETIVFDKTGTLTTGELSVREVRTLSRYPEEEILRLSAICESVSAHPIAKAVFAKNPSVPAPEEAEEIPGKGIRARIGDATYLCGSYRLMEEAGLSTKGIPEANLYLSDRKEILGYIQVGDTCKPEAAKALSELKQSGIRRTVMLTGDREQAAELIRSKLSLDECRANLLPQDKVTALREIKKTGTTAFVGDGINDGPVLASADLGIAMGMGSDLATQTADIVLLSDKLTSIPAAINVSKKGMRIARVNIVFIFIVKAIVLVLGGLGFAPMWVAVFADVGVSLLTVLNAMRIVRMK